MHLEMFQIAHVHCSASEALEVLKREKLNFDIIISDLGLPGEH